MPAWTYAFISLGCLPRSGHAGSYGNCMFNLWRKSMLFPWWPHHSAFPPAVNECSDFSTSSPALTFSCILSVPVVWRAAPCGFDLYLPDGAGGRAPFHGLGGHFYVFFGETSIHVTSLLFKRGLSFWQQGRGHSGEFILRFWNDFIDY